jgi:hypothetical protein
MTAHGPELWALRNENLCAVIDRAYSPIPAIKRYKDFWKLFGLGDRYTLWCSHETAVLLLR